MAKINGSLWEASDNGYFCGSHACYLVGCSKNLLHRFQGGTGNARTVETGPAFPLASMQFCHTFATRFIDHVHVQALYNSIDCIDYVTGIGNLCAVLALPVTDTDLATGEEGGKAWI